MNLTRNGKIARLPDGLREELNRRLLNGERGNKLVVWLNAQPEVQAVMAEEFDGGAIRPQNLSEWKQGGYADWLGQQEALKMLKKLFSDGEVPFSAAQGPIADKTVAWLAARYLVEAQKLKAGEDEADWNRLRELCHDVLALRRANHHAQRLEFERGLAVLADGHHDRQPSNSFADERS
ncbi:MAG: hypothetical protein P4N60_05690 [Verrucomicrobiae bacterium]|nr:hypothetical protein [Verrucomicrobiae bacterium]